MESFLDLAYLYQQIKKEINAMPYMELELPEAFKSEMTSIGDRSIVYYKYTARACRSTADSIIIPNFWFYLAVKLVPYNDELHRYYDQVIGMNLFSNQRLNDLKKEGAALTVEEEQKIDNSCSSSDDAKKIKRFLVDYHWWHGGKELGRGQKDYYVSAVLSLSGLINDSSSYLAAICEHLRTKPHLVSLLNEYYNRKKDRTPQISNKSIDINIRYRQFITAIKTKPFILLAGISGTGKSQIVKEMAFATCPALDNLRENAASPGNYCLIEVKPNWHDSTELLGYDSAIKKHYVVTKFVKFVVKAMRYPEVPFFVCLDEMNLAPVEQYFAEFLSVLESRKLVNDKIISEPLISREAFNNDIVAKDLFDLQLPSVGEMHVKSAALSDADLGDNAEIWHLLKDDGLCIPQNLIVIGTVNMDETTHQFSRKVIDRAMTFEMNEANFVSYFEDKVTLNYVDKPLDANQFFAHNVSGNKAMEEFITLDEQFKANVSTLLNGLNEALNDTPFKIAYRVQNELILYYTELLRENADAKLATALDDIMMMKVLPRIEGDDELLGNRSSGALHNLKVFAEQHNLTKSIDKIEEMLKRLERSHFSSFWP